MGERYFIDGWGTSNLAGARFWTDHRHVVTVLEGHLKIERLDAVPTLWPCAKPVREWPHSTSFDISSICSGRDLCGGLGEWSQYERDGVRLKLTAWAQETVLILRGWQTTNFRPIFVMNIGIDFRRDAGGIETILAILPRTRYPVLFTGLNVEVVGFEASSLQTLERSATVIHRGTRLRERDTADTCGAGKSPCF
jgi:hypothetical protein